MYQVFLGLGSNLGDRLENLSRAVEEIKAITIVDAISSIYETKPIDMDSENLFYNMVVGIHTPDDPPLLLTQLRKIERKLGRKHSIHKEPRTIDIDILLYKGLAYEDHTVKVPHPGLEHRRFVLEPFCEIAPTAIHPNLEKTIASLLRNCSDVHSVMKTDIQLNLVKLY
ncbi:MAG: 2-amino-4-hydroxy-6-hydroxymethyldihydropteridine diphosphokinase [Bacteroidota bacterium]|nr:2-amino-4-hydroxy-6-hydroxymethyldihydropteridine diphosphokinase [Bacteroidota bacterium]